MRRLVPVLAQANQLPGVSAGYANESGNLVRLTLQPGADAARIAAAAEGLLKKHVPDRTPVRLDAPGSAARIPADQWRDRDLVTKLAALEAERTEPNTSGLWAGLLLVFLAAAFSFVIWWRRARPQVVR